MHNRPPDHPAVSLPKPHGPKAHPGGRHSARLPRATHARHATTDMYMAHRHVGRKPNWWFVAGCALFMICYFLPWFSAGGGSLLGFEVSYYVPRVLQAKYAAPGLVLASNSLWIFAFIGVWALFALGDEFTGMRRSKNRWWLRLVTAFAPLIALVFVIGTFAMLNADVLAEIGRGVQSAGAGTAAVGVIGIFAALLGLSSFGLWVMLIAMVLCGVSVAVHPRPAPAANHAHHGAPAPAH